MPDNAPLAAPLRALPKDIITTLSFSLF
jgi:hypothetical protein